MRKFLAMLIIVFSAAAPADARGLNNAYMEQFRQLMDELLKADNLMFAHMQNIARKLDAYYVKHGHLPYAGTQQERFKAAADKDLPQNPYKPQTTELYYGMKLDDDGRAKMYFLNDSFLTIEQVKTFRQQAPEGWKADPGTIMVMVNGEATYAIWATSADRMPLRDYQRNNRTRIISHNLSTEAARLQAQ